MLVLSRRKGEAIIVGDAVIKVVSVDRGKVKLGIEAPKEIPVHRLEVWETIQEQKEQERATISDQATPSGQPSA